MPTTVSQAAPRGSKNSPPSTVTFKPNVRVKTLTPFLARTLFMLEYCVRMNLFKTALPPELVITSINDSVHSDGSKHYEDNAIDIRSHNFPSEAARVAFRHELERALNRSPNGDVYAPKLFTVLYENPGTDNAHFHVQVAKGRVFRGE